MYMHRLVTNHDVHRGSTASMGIWSVFLFRCRKSRSYLPASGVLTRSDRLIAFFPIRSALTGRYGIAFANSCSRS